MNTLIAQMTGQRVQENVPVPVAAKSRARFPRSRGHRDIQRRTASAMMGMAEGEEIIPDSAEEIDNYGGAAGTKVDRKQVDQDMEPENPMTPDNAGENDEDNQLITPKAALVAPDVTPHTLEPIDPSDVPPAKPAPAVPGVNLGQERRPEPAVDPMDVLLGRKPAGASPLPQETPVTAESAQATINTTLGVNTPADLLGRGKEMPPPQQADTKKIMEAFSRFRR